MRTFLALVVFAMCCVGVALVTQGCGGDDGDSDATVVTNTVTVTNEPQSTASAAGNWNGTLGPGVPFSMTLSQNGAALTGSYSIQGDSGTVSGDTSGGNIDLTVTVSPGTPAEIVSEWNGSISADMNSADGTYNIISGSTGSASWSMTK